MANDKGSFQIPAEYLRAAAQIQEQMEKAAETVLPMINQLNSFATKHGKTIRQISGALSEIGKTIALAERNSRAFDEVGWLPHYTTPFEKIEACDWNVEKIDGILTAHYQENWEEIKKELQKQVSDYHIDEEAKNTFYESLAAHENGLYRCVCRLLFPEIERIVRYDLYSDNITEKSKKFHDTLQELAGSISPGRMEPHGYYGLRMYLKLTDHLYVNVRTDQDRQRVANDSVPNRHAALHGIVAYNSMKNSLNMILMADFAFQVIDIIKRERAESAAFAAQG